MKSLKLALITVIALMFLAPAAMADQKAGHEKELGEKLLRQLWADIKESDMVAIEKKIAKGFQSVHQYGAANREQEIKLLKGLKLGKYILSNIRITRNGPVIVATYLVSVEETIKGKRLTKKPAPRLSVFLKTDSGWKWMAHANLKPFK